MVALLRYAHPSTHTSSHKRKGKGSKVSTPPHEFKFYVSPRESPEEREIRWNKWVEELQTDGLTVQGTGPDGDYPIRYSFGQEDELTFDEWWKGNPDEPFFEVYNVVPLPSPSAVVAD